MQISNAAEMGQVIRAARKRAELTQAQLAMAAGVGERFIRELEKGKPSCQLEKALAVLLTLGIKLEVL